MIPPALQSNSGKHVKSNHPLKLTHEKISFKTQSHGHHADLLLITTC